MRRFIFVLMLSSVLPTYDSSSSDALTVSVNSATALVSQPVEKISGKIAKNYNSEFISVLLETGDEIRLSVFAPLYQDQALYKLELGDAIELVSDEMGGRVHILIAGEEQLPVLEGSFFFSERAKKRCYEDAVKVAQILECIGGFTKTVEKLNLHLLKQLKLVGTAKDYTTAVSAFDQHVSFSKTVLGRVFRKNSQHQSTRDIEWAELASKFALARFEALVQLVSIRGVEIMDDRYNSP